MPLPPDERLEDAARRYGSMRSFAAEYLRERIISGVLLPGESLQIDEIAQRLKVSATPVREALQSLRVEGFVHSGTRRRSQPAISVRFTSPSTALTPASSRASTGWPRATPTLRS